MSTTGKAFRKLKSKQSSRGEKKYAKGLKKKKYRPGEGSISKAHHHVTRKIENG